MYSVPCIIYYGTKSDNILLFQHQHEVMNHSCGICGDPYDGERPSEAGGPFANGIIVAYYDKGATIQVQAEITALHLGYFEFR